MKSEQLVKLVAVSTPRIDGVTTAEELIAYCARVSNPANQSNMDTGPKLVRYLLKNKHWSPLEMVSVTVEINTTRDIARQILRHRSFSFQEFCLSGDTDIYFAVPQKLRAGHYTPTTKMKLADLYDKWAHGSKPIPHSHNSSHAIRFDMKDRIKEMHIKCYDEETGELTTAHIKEVFSTGRKPIYRITLSDGKQIKTTKEHKFLTQTGFDSLENIVGLEMHGDRALMTKSSQIAVNGIPLYQDPHWLAAKNRVQSSYTVDWRSIEKIEYLGMEETYDIEIDHTSHNYIANGIVTHNSQRYADPTKELNFVTKECRLQDDKNRQNSLSNKDKSLGEEWEARQRGVILRAQTTYEWAIKNGIAKEQARAVLPEGCTMSRLYMSGSIRSWVHYCDLRRKNGTQLEHRKVAEQCWQILKQEFPSIAEALEGE